MLHQRLAYLRPEIQLFNMILLASIGIHAGLGMHSCILDSPSLSQINPILLPDQRTYIRKLITRHWRKHHCYGIYFGLKLRRCDWLTSFTPLVFIAKSWSNWIWYQPALRRLPCVIGWSSTGNSVSATYTFCWLSIKFVDRAILFSYVGLDFHFEWFGMSYQYGYTPATSEKYIRIYAFVNLAFRGCGKDMQYA